ncbi:hypothetical protein IFM89_000402 [Coptis chinensis]|uniref:Uncharacterized protein n=1 Tax=Coptis chinensis TaxID=261450 RepID=A0A835HA03_9MAGN|nr:hypothetical protein IFM89_000402 [Coptis chinensis]
MVTPSTITSEFNEPDFPEYDTTPYGGGYDISTTYGKPLPPNDIICYPRSSSVPNQNGQKPKVENESIPPSNDNSLTPHEIHKEVDHVDHIPNPQNGFTPLFNDNDFSNEHDLDIPIESNLRQELPDYGYDYTSQENGYSGYESLVPLPPSDYIEPCGSIFGYWPCLLKDYQKNVKQNCYEHGYGNEWKGTEEYFFGSSYPYNDSKDDSVGKVDFNYGYEKHHVEQPTYVQEENNEQLWSQKLNYSYYESYQES